MLSYVVTVVGIILLRFHTSVKLGQNNFCNARLPGSPQLFRVGGHRQLCQLHGNPLRADKPQPLRKLTDCRRSLFFYFISQLGGKTHRPHHAQGVLRKTLSGVAHASDYLIFNILKTAELIHKPRLFIVGHGVDCEVSPFQVLFKAGGKGHAFRVSAVLVLAVNAVCRHLKAFFSEHHRDCPVLNSCVYGVPKKLLYQKGGGGGGDIPIRRLPP